MTTASWWQQRLRQQQQQSRLATWQARCRVRPVALLIGVKKEPTILADSDRLTVACIVTAHAVYTTRGYEGCRLLHGMPWHSGQQNVHSRTRGFMFQNA